LIDVCGTGPTPMRGERIAIALPKGRLFPQALIDALRSQVSVRHGGTRCD